MFFGGGERIIKNTPWGVFYWFNYFKLSLLGSAYGACTCARAAIDALVLVDYVLVLALRNAGYGALICACATVDAIITNLVSHFLFHPFGF